jgi:hypothetical protein
LAVADDGGSSGCDGGEAADGVPLVVLFSPPPPFCGSAAAIGIVRPRPVAVPFWDGLKIGQKFLNNFYADL